MLARELRWELREVTTAWGRTASWDLLELELDTWQLEQESEAEDKARKRQQ